MSTVITWKVTDSLAYSRDRGTIFNEIEHQSNVKTSDSHESDDDGAVVVIGSEAEAAPDTEEIQNSEVKVQSTTPETQLPTEPSTTGQEPQNPPPQTNVLVHFEIPSGSAGMKIAQILEDKGLIDNTAAFIGRIEELNLAAKLKSGTFEISQGTPLDDIIYIITGTKR